MARIFSSSGPWFICLNVKIETPDGRRGVGKGEDKSLLVFSALPCHLLRSAIGVASPCSWFLPGFTFHFTEILDTKKRLESPPYQWPSPVCLHHATEVGRFVAHVLLQPTISHFLGGTVLTILTKLDSKNCLRTANAPWKWKLYLQPQEMCTLICDLEVHRTSIASIGLCLPLDRLQFLF